MKQTRKAMKRLFAFACALFLMAGTAMADGNTMILPSSLQTVEQQAFAGTAAKVVVIPEDTSEIGEYAFNPADDLTDVYLPAKKMTIADNAFDPGHKICFHYYLGSGNYEWLQEKGYAEDAVLITKEAPVPSADAWKQVNDTISTESVSALNDNLFGTSRLILKTNGNEIPALDQFNPKKTIPLGNNLFVIQFNNHNDAGACCSALKNWDGCVYVEADYFLSSTEGAGSEPQTLMAFSEDDPMGFQKYTEYLGENVGSVKIAVIDSGVNAGEVSCSVSDLSYDFITNQNKKSGFASAHGTNVAKELCAAFGALKSHLTILSYRIENPNNGAISYIQMGEALLQAREDGADFANISIAGESAYSDAQDNEFLRECINLFGSSKVIAAAGNSAVSANRFIPGKYCVSVTGVSLYEGQLIRAAGTATNAKYGGFASTTSMAAPKVTAAFALLSLNPDNTHSMADALESVETIQNGMPNLGNLAVKLVNEIVINNGYPIATSYSSNATIYITYNVSPANATIPTVTVRSTNTNVLRVDSYAGNSVQIKTRNPGEAELVFTSEDGNAEKRLLIRVVEYPTSVSISGNSTETLKKGQTRALSATVLPENASDRTVTWTSSNENIATVSDNGIVTQVGEGSVIITATANGDQDVYASVTVNVSNEVPAEGVIISPAGGVNTLYHGSSSATVQMGATVQPSTAVQTVTWTSSNTGVATIDNSGLVTSTGKGSTTITATASDGKTKGYYEITVVQLPTGLTLSGPTTVMENIEIQLTATVTPSNANNPAVNWSSNNTNVATVTGGKVKGIKAGTAVITASCAANGNVAKTWTVTVEPATFTVTYNANGGICNQTGFTATRGVQFGTLAVPTWSYHTFDGWYTAASGGTKVTASTSYSAANNITIYAHWTENPWSDWVTSVPSGAATRATKTQWRYRDQVTNYSEYSAWTLWSTTRQTVSDSNLTQEETATKRKWWAAQCKSCGRNNPYWGQDKNGVYVRCKSCSKQMTSANTLHVLYYTSDTSGSTIDGRTNGRVYDGKPYWMTSDTNTCYRYRTRTVSYSWGSWSNWSDSSVASSSTRQVETRTLYKYQNP